MSEEGSVRWFCGRCRMEVTTDYTDRLFKFCPNCGGGMVIKRKVKPGK